MADAQPTQTTWKMLKQGDTGSEVLNLQMLLVKHAGATFTPNGTFGPATDAAVRAFQKAHGLTVDGLVGYKTFSAIADLAPAPQVEAAPAGGYVTAEQLVKGLNLHASMAAQVVGPINKAIAKFNLNTKLRAAAWLANIAHESGGFASLVENLNYSAARLAAVWPNRFRGANGEPNQLALQLAGNQQSIANFVYADRMGNGSPTSGDGWKYRGRGPIGITGKDMYIKVRSATGIDVVTNPDLLAQITDASFESAAWFMVQCGGVKHADIGDFDGVADLINLGRKTDKYGDSIGWPDRLAKYKSMLAVL